MPTPQPQPPIALGDAAEARPPSLVPSLVDALRAARAAGPRPSPEVPSKSEVESLFDLLRAVLFPTVFGDAALEESAVDYFVGQRLDLALRALTAQVQRALRFVGDGAVAERTARAVTGFASELPAIRRALDQDVLAAFDGDPAARSADEVLLCYPGITAITAYRIAHALWSRDVPLIPRIISELAHSRTGIDIHPGAKIGARFFIDHGTGVVIGETSRIGDRVRIYQGVTLGAKNLAADADGHVRKQYDRHPILEDDVVVYSGATILGRITIGSGSTIGGNVWLTRSVPQNSSISQARARSEAFDDGAGI
jgi:serine O-acetyltransferase